MRKRIFFISVLTLLLILTSCGIKGTYRKYSASEIGYVLPEGYNERSLKTEDGKSYIRGTVKDKDAMEYEIHNWKLPDNVKPSTIPESGEYVDDENFITVEESKKLIAAELENKVKELSSVYGVNFEETDVNDLSGYTFTYKEAIENGENTVVAYIFASGNYLVCFKTFSSNATETEFALQFVDGLEKYKQPFKFHGADKGLLIIIAIVVAGIVAFYFLQPIIRRKEFEEQRANFVKREATFRENLENLQSEKENKEKKN